MDASLPAPSDSRGPRRRTLRNAVVALVVVAVSVLVGIRVTSGGDDQSSTAGPAYRYVSRPLGVDSASTKKPVRAAQVVPVVAGVSAAGTTVSSDEPRPQVYLFLPLAGLRSPGRTVEVAAQPLAPTALPRGFEAEGNRYRVTLTDAAGPVRLTEQGAFATVQLLTTRTSARDAVILTKSDAAGRWRQLETTRGGDVFGAPLVGEGDYQLAYRSAGRSPGRAGPDGVVVLTGALIVLAAAVLAVRSSRFRTA